MRSTNSSSMIETTEEMPRCATFNGVSMV